MTTPTVAGPRQAAPRETYTGGELQTRSPRAGAYDALKLPSRMGDRLVEPGGALVSLAASAREPKPVPLQHRAAPAAPQRAPAKARVAAHYRPRPGSIPGRTADALAEPDSPGYLTLGQICQRFNVPAWQIGPSLASAIEHGAFKQITVQGQAAIALPGVSIEPSAAPVDEPPPGPAVDVLAATRETWRPPFDPALMQRFAVSTATLAAAFAQIEQQALVVVQAMGEMLKAWAKAEASMNKKTGSSDAA